MRNSYFGVLSTAIAGLSSIIVQLVAAGMLTSTEFSLFSIAATTVLFVVGLSRVHIAQVDMVRGSTASHHGPVEAAYLTALVWLGLGAIGLGVAHLTGIQTLVAVFGGLAASSIFVLQDSLRFRCYRMRRASIALLSDAVTLTVACGLMLAFGAIVLTAFGALAVWAIAVGLGFGMGAMMLRYRPQTMRGGPHWLVQNRDLVIPGAGEFLLQSAIPYALNFLILAVGGVEALAGYRLAQLIFALPGNLASGLNAVMLPNLADSRDPGLARRYSAIEIISLSAVSLGVLVALLLVPPTLGATLFGENWSAMAPFMLVGAIHGWFNALSTPVFSLLRLLRMAMFSFYVRCGSALVTAIWSLIAFTQGDAVGIAWSMAATAAAAYFVRLGVADARLRDLVASARLIP